MRNKYRLPVWILIESKKAKWYSIVFCGKLQGKINYIKGIGNLKNSDKAWNHTVFSKNKSSKKTKTTLIPKTDDEIRPNLKKT